MDEQNIIGQVKSAYETNVKPYILTKDFPRAHLEMGNLRLVVGQHIHIMPLDYNAKTLFLYLASLDSRLENPPEETVLKEAVKTLEGFLENPNSSRPTQK